MADFVPNQTTVERFGNWLMGPSLDPATLPPEVLNGKQPPGKGHVGFVVNGTRYWKDRDGQFHIAQMSDTSRDFSKAFQALGLLVPGFQPFLAASNAVKAIDNGDVLGGLAGLTGVGGFTEISNALTAAKAIESGDPLAIAFAGANLGGVTDVGGVSVKDIANTVGTIKAIESGDPLALLRYGTSALKGSNNTASSLGPGNMDEFSENLIPGYFQPGGEGYIAPSIQDTTGLDEGPIIPINETPTPNIVDQLLNSGMPSSDEDFMPTLPTPTETKPEEKTDWNALYNTGLSPEEIAKREALMASLPNQEMQIDPKNWESFDKNLSDIMTNKGGYTSQWQTVGNDRVMVNDDGTGIGTNENGDSYALSQEEVDSMIKNGMLNTADSGYVAATGGTGNTPGGTKAPIVKAPTGAPVRTPTTPTTPKTPMSSSSGMDMMGLMALLGGQQQAQQPVQQAPMQDPYANIKLMEDLFGSKIDLTPTSGRAA